MQPEVNASRPEFPNNNTASDWEVPAPKVKTIRKHFRRLRASSVQ